MKKAVYPGSFDPITLGHTNIIRRAAAVCDNLTVCVMVNSDKNYMFSTEERLDFAKRSVKDFKNVTVECFDGLLADFMQHTGCNVIIKGLRTTDDFNFEVQMDRINKKLYGKLETIFLAADPELLHVSSTVAREMIRYGRGVEDYLPPEIVEIINTDKCLGGNNDGWER